MNFSDCRSFDSFNCCVCEGLNSADYDVQLSTSVQSLVIAAKTIVTRTSYLLLAVVFVAFAVHVASSVLFYHFRLATLPEVHPSSAACPGDARRHCHLAGARTYTAAAAADTAYGRPTRIRPPHGLPPRAASATPADVVGRFVSRPRKIDNDVDDEVDYDSGTEDVPDIRTPASRHPAASLPPELALQQRGGGGGGSCLSRTSTLTSGTVPLQQQQPLSSSSSLCGISSNAADFKYSETKV